MAHRTKRIHDFADRLCLIARLTVHTDDNQRQHEQKDAEENRRPRRKLSDSTAERQKRIDGKSPVQHLRCRIIVLPIHADQPRFGVQCGHDFLKCTVPQCGHCNKGGTSRTVSHNEVYLLPRLQMLPQFPRGHNKDGIAFDRRCSVPRARSIANCLPDNIVPILHAVRDKLRHTPLLLLHAREYAPVH